MRVLRRRKLHPAVLPLVGCLAIAGLWFLLNQSMHDFSGRLTTHCPRASPTSMDSAHLPVCVTTRRGSCISLSSGDTRACPRTYPMDSCRALPDTLDVAHVCAVVAVTSSVGCPCTLPSKLLRLLLELDVAVEFSLFVTDGIDDSCARSAYKLLRDAGMAVHTCHGDSCPSPVTYACKAKMTVVVRDTVDLAPGAFKQMLNAVQQMPGSVISPSIYSHGGQPIFSADPTSFTLTQIEVLPSLCLLGHTESFSTYEPQQLFLTPTFTSNSLYVHTAKVHLASAERIQVQRTPVKNLLFIDGYLPMPDRDSGSRRTCALVSLLIQQRHRVTFQTIVTLDQVNLGTPADQEKYKVIMSALGARVLRPGLPHSWPKEPYDVIIVSRRNTMPHVIDFLKREYPKAGIMYDTVDLHFVRETRLAMATSVSEDTNLTTGITEMNAWLSDPLNADTAIKLRESRAQELSFITKSHVTIVVSDYEEEVLRQYLPQAPVVIISNIIVPPLTFDLRSAPTCGERSGMLFVGQFGHTPNQQAIDALLKYVIPVIMQSPKWDKIPPIHIAGSGKLPQVLAQRMARHSFIHVHNDLSDAELAFLYMEVRVAVAPLVSGAGVKGKINQAMSLGVPVVATSVAVEAMHIRHGQDCMVAETLQQFIEYLEEVYFNDALCNRLARNAYQSVYRHFSMQEARSQLIKGLDRLALVLGNDVE